MLKNLLALLLAKFYSKEESGLVARQAMPTRDYDVTLNLTIGSESSYFAPTDGYFNVEVGPTGSINCWGSLIASASNGKWNKVFIPVKKGQEIKYQISGTILFAVFVKLVGGVQALKDFILQGGVLCRLKHLYSSLLRSFCRVRKNGLLNNGTCRLRMWLIFLFQTTMTFILMFLQRTVCWCLGNLVRRELVTWKSTPLVRDLISISQALEFTKVLQCRLIEAKRFLSRQPQITEDIIRSFTSSRLSVKREVGLGGASC